MCSLGAVTFPGQGELARNGVVAITAARTERSGFERYGLAGTRPYPVLGPALVGQTVTTIFPTCSLLSMKRVASTISSSLKVRAMTGFSAPEAKPSTMNALASSSRSGSVVISKSW